MTAHAAAPPTVTGIKLDTGRQCLGPLEHDRLRDRCRGLRRRGPPARGNKAAFYAAWLVAFVYFSRSPGSLYFILIHTAMQGGWGIVVRRVAENTAATLPLFALLFVPVAVGLNELYPWSLPSASSDPLIQAKAAYLNPTFFHVRALFFFAVWSGIAWWFVGLSYRQDQTPDEGLAARLRRFSGPMLLPLALTHHFASVDWVMSLDPHWYSRCSGSIVSGALVSAFAFLAVVVVALRSAHAPRRVHRRHLQDLGTPSSRSRCLGLHRVRQYFLIWYGNIPEETIWFKHRLDGAGVRFPWPSPSALAALLLLLHGRSKDPVTLLAAALWCSRCTFRLVLDGGAALKPTAPSMGVDVAASCGGRIVLGRLDGSSNGTPRPLGDPRLSSRDVELFDRGRSSEGQAAYDASDHGRNSARDLETATLFGEVLALGAIAAWPVPRVRGNFRHRRL